ncbi:hypothetical protein BKA65DRAFT_575973 [Rhexocercosporidium sp. MPI-PUGE-AT-0058]|nr:hypothetical protein BKA65DRAFT_575973 [Rhexocercosporidium sp. MPI-PUGE-AT-0058]
MDTESPLVDDSRGPHALLIVTLLLTLALLCFSARIYTRAFPTYKLNPSNYMNSFAIFAELVTFSLFTASVNAGFGRHSVFDLNNILDGYSSTIGRMEKIPLGDAWGKSGHCISSSGRLIINYTRAGIGIINDLVFAIVPTFLIWKLSRSRWELCLVSTLTSLGLCAAGMGIGYIFHSQSARSSTGPSRSAVVLSMYCRLKEILLLIASSAPFLKAPIKCVLRQFSAPGFHNIPRDLVTYHSNGASDSQELNARPRQGFGRQKTQSDGGLNAMQVA